MPLSLAECTYDGTAGFKIADHPTSAKVKKSEREKCEQLTAANTLKIAKLQDRLYAESREGVVILIQAMDAVRSATSSDTYGIADTDSSRSSSTRARASRQSALSHVSMTSARTESSPSLTCVSASFGTSI